MNAPELIHIPPHSIEAEQALIGGLLLDNSAWDRIADILAEGDFYRDDHRRIFRHLAQLIGAGKNADVVTVFASIEASNEVEQTGGMGYLGEIANATPSAANIRRYAEIVRQKATLRRLILAADEFSAGCYSPGNRSAEELAAIAEAKFSEVLDSRADEPAALSDVFGEVMSYVDARDETGGLPTGFRELDSMTGGLEGGQLIIVAARPSVGKTAFALNVADHVAERGSAVLFFTLEMSRRELAMRALAARSSVSVHAMRAGTKDEAEWRRMSAASATAAELRLFIDDRPAVSVPYIRARARRMKRQRGLDLVVIDYLGLMTGTGDNRTQQLGSISRGLKALAKELEVPIIALAQLNRGVESRQDKRPILSDLRDSGEIEQDADIVVMLHRESLYSDAPEWSGVADLLVRKNRNGPTGDALLSWWPAETRFTDHVGGNPRHRAFEAKRPAKGFD